MAGKTLPSRHYRQRGFTTSDQRAAGWCDPDQPEPQEAAARELPKGAVIELFGPNDGYVAMAVGTKLKIFTFEDFSGHRGEPDPFAEMDLDVPLSSLAAGRSGRLTLFGVDEKNGLIAVDCTPLKGEEGPISAKPRLKRLDPRIEGPIRKLHVQRDGLIVQARRPKQTGRAIYRADLRLSQVMAVGHVSSEGDLTPLGQQSHNLFLARRQSEARIVVLPEDEAGRIESYPLGADRVTAATLLDATYVVVAKKGGQIEKARLTTALPPQAAVAGDPLARACRILCELLRRCDCPDCRCHDDRPEDPNRPERPDDGPGDGGPADDEPCGDRHRGKLSWTPTQIVRIGAQMVALSAGNRRMAVLDGSLNVLFEQKIDQRGAEVVTGQAHTQRMLVLRPEKAQFQAWELADYVATLPGFGAGNFIPVPLPEPTKVTYFGKKNPPALANPTVRICVFTVREPGQAFGDPDQTKLVNQITPNVFDVVDDYYRECSFGETDIQFDVFAHDIGGTGTPLVLPRPVASYFWDDFVPGGLMAVMPADFSDPLVLDGTEAFSMRANPRTGESRDYDLPFAALWTNVNHGAFPVEIDFDGTETVELTVETQTGASLVLNVAFSAQTFSHNQGEDTAAFLASLGTYVTDSIRTAEAALPGSPVTIQDVEFRRIRTNEDAATFGRLQGRFKVAASGGATQKGRITITGPGGPTPGALSAIGLTTNAERGVIDSQGAASDYFRECLRAGQTDANEGPGAQDPYFQTSANVSLDAVAQELTVRIRLTSERGGEGADIERLSASGLAGTGWDTASPDPGSDSNANNQNALRDSIEMADDTFTAALDRLRSLGPWDPAAAEALFANYDVMMIGFVGQPPASVPAGDAWNSASPVDFGRLRMFARSHFATDQNNPNPGDDPVQMGTSRIIGQKFSSFSSGVMAHEIGHALGLPDLYSAQGYRDDVAYVDPYAMMAGGNSNFHHFIGWSKWKLGWIVEDPSDDELNRVIEVPMPSAGGPTTTESWLVPVEHWDGTMHDDVRAEVGGTVQIGQLMKLHLGSDGGVLAFLELRAEGAQFSQNLSNDPTVIATNGLDPDNDRRWAVNGLYRRSVHLLNTGMELRNPGDTWDFATAPEFPVKGCVAEVIETRTIRGSIPIFRVAVTREQAEFIDLHFQDHVPSWKSPDIWIDWRNDNPDPDVPRMYPEGTPTDQGETVRFPASGTEPHFVVARVHNAGNVRAEDVKVRWFICDPPGAGDDGRWVERGTQTIEQVDAGNFEIAPFDWDVDSSTNVHQCLRMEIIDWTIPAEVDPSTGDTVALASDDVRLQNNNAQQNVFDFEALAGSPYTPITFEMQVYNDYVEPERCSLVPSNLPYGATIEISPAEAIIQPDSAAVFSCMLTLKEAVVRPGCDNDQGFLLSAWRRGVEADELWGSCFYWIRPRYRTETEFFRGTWFNGRVHVYGAVRVVADEASIATDAPHQVRVRLHFDPDGQTRRAWFTVPVAADGTFQLATEPHKGEVLFAQAWFDRTDSLGSSVSKPMELKHSRLF